MRNLYGVINVKICREDGISCLLVRHNSASLTKGRCLKEGDCKHLESADDRVRTTEEDRCELNVVEKCYSVSGRPDYNI